MIQFAFHKEQYVFKVRENAKSLNYEIPSAFFAQEGFSIEVVLLAMLKIIVLPKEIIYGT